ncbi:MULTISPECIES: hypothetical protein [Streptosporangium]|uniref:Integral membrane protein n=1 Tax=Streptosporangium brasiliense TaxID=47480 RepID=A0ABT9RKR9_9ACTN|nr:hypothetical protein [Streptosporangium brasiliense]MDP9869329.1 hypothetical protein [Streptosporangium brasiliense]
MDNNPRSGSKPLLSVLAVGAVFGAATSLVNAVAQLSVDLESREATTGGWSVMEIVSVLLDSGWAWAGSAVLAGLLATRAEQGGLEARTLARGAVAGALALLAATAAYYAVDTVVHGVSLGSYGYDTVYWWAASILLGPILGAIGACARRPGAIGVLAKVTVPVGAAVQMFVMPPGRNEVITTVGQWVVWTTAAVSIGMVAVHVLGLRRQRDFSGGAELP